MYWTLDLISHMKDALYPATRDELIDYAILSGAPLLARGEPIPTSFRPTPSTAKLPCCWRKAFRLVT